MNELYKYLEETYGENEPIFIENIHYADMSDQHMYRQIKILIEKGVLKQFDSEICFIPKKSIFKSGTQLSIYKVLERKYLFDGNKRCGYLSGVVIANQLGLTSQVSQAYEVVTNKAVNEYSEVKIAKIRVIIRKPKVVVNEQNYQILQLLDLIENIDYYAENEGKELVKRLQEYLKNNGIKFENVRTYLRYYGNEVCKKVFEMEW